MWAAARAEAALSGGRRRSTQLVHPPGGIVEGDSLSVEVKVMPVPAP